MSSSIVELKLEESRVLADYAIPAQDFLFLQELGFAGSDGVVLEKTDYVHDEKYIYYLMEGDIEIRKDLLKVMATQAVNGGRAEQFRTTNLVNGPFPRTIRIIAINMTNSTLRQGLTLAVENYNSIGINLNFTLEFRTVTTIPQIVAAESDSDILAKQLGTEAGGKSGTPSSGNPFPSIFVSAITANFGLNVVEHVFTHEMGHTIGFRHSDYFNRSLSCGGSAINEGDGGVGAIHIPGTPATTNVDSNSIMESCVNGTASGEFSAFDLVALNTIY